MRKISCLLMTAVLSIATSVFAAEGPIDGYADYEKFREQVQVLARSEWVTLRSLATTRGGREVYLLTVGRGKTDEKPAMLIVGGVHAPHLAGSELALRTISQLLRTQGTDKDAAALLERYTLYVIPRPSPDAGERFFEKPYAERTGNLRKTDDDRDGQVGEDPADDLNGDGWITMMRIEDAAGDYIPHPDDPRVMIKIDRKKKNERGRYRLLVEGRDNDGDEAHNEDGSAGVDFNRNFTFNYPYFKTGAGPNQVSEPETRAVADFAFSRPNIALVFSFTPEDNLFHVWKPDAGSEKKRIKTKILSADAPYVNYLAERYRKIHTGKDAPASPKGEGSFSEWAYFHYGRWSLAARGWWIPKVDPPKPAEGEKEKKLSDEKRGATELNALRWFAREKIDGFVDWKPIEHPDFPGAKVEVGGFKPLLRLNPPAKLLDDLAARHAKFLAATGKLMPVVAIKETQVESLGEGVFRLKVTVTNTGYLPTMPAMGKVSQQAYPLMLTLELPKGAKLITGTRRTALEPIAGGGTIEKTWLLRLSEDKSKNVKITVTAPAVGSTEKTIELK
ncbi:MAG: hypothetical protein IID44_16625 [Planctomycetes bacterium]|nr:hypothetical protein [Planctomycetota bacterium]